MDDLLKRLTEKKEQLDKLRPLPKELEQNLDDWLRVELTYSSNAIEGNTLSRIETAEVLERGVAAVIKGKPLKDQLEALNHVKALEFIKTLAHTLKSHQYITEEKIKAIHKIILTGINDEWAGKYRETEVFIRGFNVDLPQPHKVPYMMTEFVQWLQGIQEHAVLVAADAHYKFVTIHPFIDGNGRTGRLLMNLVLLIHGYPMAIIRNEERTQYLNALNTAQTKGNLQPFYTIVATAVERMLDAYINAAKGNPVLSALMKPTIKKLLKIGELAKETGETLHAIRHWTQKGLLEVAEHTEAGYQLFDRSMIERVKEIRRLQKEERLSIDEIKNRL
ncbi:Fic family protein [Candidatus Microgenomates bacterium]|nr:Fic family protein [Candidatus Microgenomates bacterium]